MAAAVRTTQARLETAREWEGDYHPVPLAPHLERQWKMGGDTLPAIQIIQRLTDGQKPHLPEGYIWVQTPQELQICKHRDAPPSSFKIHLFGPDSKERIQFIVETEQVPQHGFAMTRGEHFPTDLRDAYPMTDKSFRSDGTPYWRGHIIDYLDTLGTPAETNISTLQPWNYKPEPPVYWARTLRKTIVEEIRAIEGAYAEIMLYGFSPTKTEGGNPIPRAVVLQEFLATKEFLTSYPVPHDHPCHGWTARKHRVDKALRELRQPEFFPALVWKPGALPRAEMGSASIDPEQLDEKGAYHLLRSAEMEHDQATRKIQYVIYGNTHHAPLETLQFWLSRAVDIALKVDDVYHSLRPSFPVSLMSRLQKGLPPSLAHYADRLQGIAARVLQAPAPTTSPVPEVSPPEPLPAPPVVEVPPPELPPAPAPAPVSAEVPPLEPAPSAPIDIVCSGPSRDDGEEIQGKIDRAITAHGVVVLKRVITIWANQFFRKIQRQIQERSVPYQLIQRIELTNRRWQRSVSSLTRQCFGENVDIVVVAP